MEHVRDDLSAYLDGALEPPRRSVIETHLGTCPQCRNALGELRSTARLIAALPAPVPSRRLVPALAPRTNWLRPLRSLSAVATGMFVLLFMASATVDTGFRMGGGDAKSTGGRLIGGPTPAALEAAPRTDASVPAAAVAGSPAPQGAADAQRSSTQSTPAPKAALSSPSPGEQVAGAAQGTPSATAREPVRFGPPWLWLGLALLSAALVVVAHRRLRAT